MERARCVECEQVFFVPRMEENYIETISVVVTDSGIPKCVPCLLRQLQLPENADLHGTNWV